VNNSATDAGLLVVLALLGAVAIASIAHRQHRQEPRPVPVPFPVIVPVRPGLPRCPGPHCPRLSSVGSSGWLYGPANPHDDYTAMDSLIGADGETFVYRDGLTGAVKRLPRKAFLRNYAGDGSGWGLVPRPASPSTN
jgi:hypothetical protein